VHTSIKSYPHELGLSCVFRQWRAESHCNTLHGYPLAFTFEFGCTKLDANGWVLDFGSLKPLKEWLTYNFDHTLLVAEDDPHLDVYYQLERLGLATLRVFPRVGCEAVAQMAYEAAQKLVRDLTDGRAFVLSCTVAEHGANSAKYSA
jgi:6-pyruvoyltetrahydropterin/6-carboxytetrahydropterin synthase